jgi:hypothetical protein
MKSLTDRELLDRIDQSLKQTAEDVRQGRIPLDGRVRFTARANDHQESALKAKFPDVEE